MSSLYARVRVALAFVLLTVAFAPAAHAVTSTFKILLDLDNQQNTGCDVPTVSGTFKGAERILIVTVDTLGTSAAQVTAVQYQSCLTNPTFSAPAAVPAPPGHPLPWPVGVSNGTGGTSVIESYIPLSLAPTGPSPNIRLGVLALDSNGVLRDELLKTKPGNGNGPPIQLQALSIAEIPTLSDWGLIFLGLVLAVAAVALLRRRTGAAFLVALLLLGLAGVAWAAVTCDLNGNTLAEWIDPPLAVDDNPDTPPSPAGADIRAFFGFKDMTLNAFSFRIDALLLFNTPPTANNDAATVVEDSGASAINVLANDTDPDVGDTFTVASVTQPANGTVAITGGGTGVSYTPNANYCNNPPGTTLDTFTYTLSPNGPNATATVTVTVTCVDDPPTAVADAATVSEDAAATAVPVLANDTDPDGGPISISAVTQPANGVVVITGGGTGLTYQPNANYCNNPPGTLDTFTYTLAPGGSSTTVSMTVTCVDDPPTAVNDAATVSEDSGANAIDVLANDTDIDAGPKSVASVTQPANGVVVITGGGTGLTYAPNADYCNTPPGTTLDTFTYTLTPGGSSATVTVNVTCVDDAPVAVNDAATVNEDSGPNAINVLANDTDVDAGPKSVASVTQPANGVVVITGGGTGLTYAPNADYCNSVSGTPDTFTYTLTPGSSTATVTVTVTCVDDNPVAVADAASVAEDSGANPIDVLANDTDIDGGPKSVASVTQPANGAVVITGGGTGVSYTPNANYCNQPPGTTPDTFTYTLAPGGSSTTVTVTVTCVDDNPVAVADAATVVEDSGANAINVLANDPDLDGGPKTVAAVTQPANGTVVITGGGTGVSYTPNANYCNTPPGSTLDTFSYSLAPGGSTATVTVSVTCVDDSPVVDLDANDDKGTTGSDFAVTFNEGDGPKLLEDPLDATVTDVDSANLASLTVTITNLLDTGFETLSADVTGTAITANYVPATGVLTLTGPDTVANFQTVLRKVTYQNTDVDPDATPRVIHFVANDGNSNSNTATSTVTIVATDTPPTAVNDSATVNEDSGANPINVLANDTDPDNGPMSVTSVTQPANGTVVITGGGTGVSYTPNANYCNSVSGTPDTFTYTLSPGGSTATVTVTVTCADDDPTAVADAATVVEDSGPNAINVLANDTDPDGGPISISSVTQPANGVVVITGGGTGLTYAPNANYCNSVSGTPDTFTYTLSPGGSSATVTVTVTCVDDNPTAVNDAATVVEDSGPNAINVLANDTDPDGGTKSVASVTQPANGAVVITGGGAGVSYTPNANYCNTPPGTTLDTFTYTLTPGGSSATVTVSVTCVDDAPVAVNDAATVAEDSGANAINVLANDTDVDGGPKSVASVTQPANGTVVITGGGTGLTYAPNANYCNSVSGTPDTFTYTLTPGGSTATVTVTVTCVDDNPVAVADAATVNEDSGANAINVLANDTDIDGGPKSVASVTQPANGAVVITGGGTGLTYAPNANYCNQPPGTTLDTFTYTLAPGGSSTTVTVTVTCVDDNPVAVADSATVVEDSGANAINVLANDTDIDGGPKSVGSVTQPANGAVVITGGGTGLTYAPNANYCNTPPGTTPDTFTYTLSPGGSSTTVSVSVTCVDDPPVAVADSATVVEDSGANAINVLANDTDIDGGPKSVASVTQPANGAVAITGGGTGVSYTPNANYCNNPPGTTPDTFTYTLTPGSSSTTVSVLVTCVNDAPTLITNPITYSTPGNTQLHVAGATRPGVAFVSDAQSALQKSNPSDIDGPGPLQVVAASGSSVNGGSFTIASDGSFSYVPPAGFTGTDSFTYSVTDNGAPAATVTGTVNITVGQRVWYIRDVVDANNAAGGDGRSTNAFDSIAAFNAATTNNGDIIFIFRGNTGATPLSGTITLKDGQKLWGEGIGLTVPGFGTLIPAGLKPLINTSGDAVLVPATAGNRQNVEIRGLDLQASGYAIRVNSTGANIVNVTIGDNNATSTSATGLNGISLSEGGTGAFTAALGNNAIATTGAATGNAFDARTTAGAGTLTIDFNNNAVVSNASGIVIDGSAGGTTFIKGFANNAVSGNTVGTGISITSAKLDANPGTVAFEQVSGGTTVVGASGAGNGVGASGMVLTNVAGDLAFTDLDVFANGGAGVRITGTGAVNVGAGTGTRVTVGTGVAIFEAIGGPAVDVTNATIDLQPTSIKSTNSASTGLALNTVAGTFSAGSGSSISNITSAAGTAFQVGSSSATVSYAGTINTTTGKGVDLTSNSGSISFTGTMTLNTGTNTAFNATGGGTVTATDTASTLTTTTGIALNVANTTIGAGGLKFRSISAGTAASGPASGIVLNNTGSSGGLTVSGTGSAGSGGTIQRAGTGISLTSTNSPSFSWMQLNDCSDFAIRGSSVVNFTLANSVINGTNGNDAAANEGSVRFSELTGSASISNSSISGSVETNLRVENTTGSLNRLTLSNTTIGTNSTTTGDDGLFFEAQATAAVMNVTVQNSFFTASRGDLAQFNNASTGTMDVVVSGTAFSDNHPAIVAGGGGVVVGAVSGTTTYNIHNNTFRDATGTALAVSCGNAGVSCIGRLENNQIGLAGTVNSGSTNASGIAVVNSGGGTVTSLINGNTIRQYNNHGILLQAGQTGGNPTSFNATVTSNTIGNPGTINTDFNGIHLNNGTLPGENFTSCVDIRSNSIAGSGTGVTVPNNADFRLRQRQSTTVRLPGYGGANNNDAAVVAFVSGNQTTVTTGASSNTVPTGGGFVGGASCPTPP
ncbi:MAG: hypothetical protein QOF89_3907 [Acidobacteriota bacterium]|jgi:hypothetical protein|nr:hypothetical protein [Acidobacteriota bacterium]